MIRSLAFLAALASAASCADLYRVAGTVVDATTGSPLAGVQVVLFLPAATEPVGSTVTRDDGKFSFNAPAGKLRLMAAMREVRQAFGLRKPDVIIPVAVITGPGFDTANLVFRWFPPAAITGRVVDRPASLSNRLSCRWSPRGSSPASVSRTPAPGPAPTIAANTASGNSPPGPTS